MEWILHVAGLTLWLGGLMAAGLMRGPEQAGQPSTQRRLLLALAWPGFVLVLLTGLGMFFRGGAVVAGGGWFHVKMTAVLILLALQILLARGRLRGAWVTPVVGLLAVGAIFLARIRPF